MQVIPVIDLQNGVVVHARKGDRANYAPLTSVICENTGYLDVIETYYRHFGFNTIYIADLNALTRQGNNHNLLLAALTAFPRVCFWIDAGYPHANASLKNFGNYLPVLGSESFQPGNLTEIKRFNKSFALSLDFGVNGRLGAAELFNDTLLWPEKIIIMELAQVGGNGGPNLTRLSDYRDRHPNRHFIAAGGIRNSSDLAALKNIGMQQALVASALHNGSLTPEDISALQ
jgi:phosphoribosylformimino-5-aminoimidazole carboxamide ribotide isomerase